MKIDRATEELNQIFQEQLYFLKESCHEYDKGIEIESIRLAGHIRTIVHDSILKKDFDLSLINKINDLKKILIEDKKVDTAEFSKVNGILQTLHSKISNTQKEQVTSKSLLTLLGTKDEIKFIDTSITERNGMSFWQFENCQNMNIDISQIPYAGLLSKKIIGFGRIKKPKLVFQPLFYQSNFNLTQCPSVDFETWWTGEIYDNRKGIIIRRKDIILNVTNQEGFAHVGESLDYKYVDYKQKNFLNFNVNDVIEEFDNIPIYPTVRQIAFELMLSLKQ